MRFFRFMTWFFAILAILCLGIMTLHLPTIRDDEVYSSFLSFAAMVPVFIADSWISRKAYFAKKQDEERGN